MNIAQHLERAARHFADKPAIVFEGRQLTYASLQDQVDRAADALVARGVERGDRAALFLPNIPEFAVAYLAIEKVGAIAVSVNVMLTTGELRYVLEDSGSTLLFTTTDLRSSWQPLVGDLLGADSVILCEGEAAGFLTLQQLTAAFSGPFKARDMDRDDPAAILYTSGTTGKQKGATLSHGNVVSNTFSIVHHQGLTPADRLLLFLPLFHCFGQNAIMNSTFATGATVVLQRRYDPQSTLALIERERVTAFFAVPTIYIGLLNEGVAPQRLATVRYCFSAAATMPLEVAERWKAAYGLPIHEGYGLTETSPSASYNHEWQHRPGSVGVPIENVEIKVFDSDDNELGPGAWGEIVIKGPNVMLGYWNRPEETAEAIRNGWFHSGDVGYMDEDGYIFLVDRTKDMINAAGFKIWPREVEEVLYEHAAVAECAVVGLPDPLKGEAAAAFLVLKPDAAVTPEELEAYCRQRLAAYKVPRQFAFVAALPKTATGKILKRVLRDQPTAAQ